MADKIKIAVVLPTRGIVFTEVEDAIEQMRLMYDIQVFRCSGKGIPDAQNYLTEKALETNPTHVFFIEEDTVPPVNALAKLLALDAPIAFVDYGVNAWSCSARTIGNTAILWCGLGCTLVKKEVFEALPTPYFRTDKSLRLNDWRWIDVPMKYGGQDIWFCMQARKAGFTIQQASGQCKHLRLEQLGTAEANKGEHTITLKPAIERWQIIEPDEGDPLTTPLGIDNVKHTGNSPQIA